MAYSETRVCQKKLNYYAAQMKSFLPIQIAKKVMSKLTYILSGLY